MRKLAAKFRVPDVGNAGDVDKSEWDTRMEAMIENSDKFVIFPGGAGTVQEMFALLILKAAGNPLMKGKSIVIYNRPIDGQTDGYWDRLLVLLKPWENEDLFTVETDLPGLLREVSP